MSRLIQVCAGGCAIIVAGVLGAALLPQPQVAASYGKQAVAKPVFVPPPAVVVPARSAPTSDAALVKLAEALKVTPTAAAPPTRALAFAGSEAAARSAPSTSSGPIPTSDMARQLCAQGLIALASGDIAGARALLLRAADEGDARALMALGETYEPATLAGLGVLGLKGDPVRARDFYNKALAAGVGAARERLAALEPN